MAGVNIRINKSLFNENDHILESKNSDISIDRSLKNEVAKTDEYFGAGKSSFKKRPTNLRDLIVSEGNLRCDTTEANFSLGDISDSEEIWVLDVPKKIHPKKFKGQTIILGKKNDFQIGNKFYETSSVTSNDDQHLSFVFNTGRHKRSYKTVNLKPAGSVRIRQKLSSVTDTNLVSPKKVCVPFPKNLKLRHPLFGYNYNKKLVTVEK